MTESYHWLTLALSVVKLQATATRDRSVDHYLHGLLLLTSQGRQADTGKLLEVFLHRIMGFGLRDWHQRALVFQPAVDEVLAEKLDDANGPNLADAPRLGLAPGTKAVVSRVVSEDADAIQYLNVHRIRTNAALELLSVAPFDGPRTVRANGKVIGLGRQLAQLVRVGKVAKVAAHGRSKGPVTTNEDERLRGASKTSRNPSTGKVASQPKAL